jgi:hypothetical protein
MTLLDRVLRMLDEACQLDAEARRLWISVRDNVR